MPPDAKTLYQTALDREAVLDDSGAIALLRRAIAADPAYFPPHIRLANIYAASGKHLELRQLYDALPNNPTVECMRAYVAAPAGYRVHAFDRIVAIEQRHGRTGCTEFMRAYLVPGLLPFGTRIREQLANTTRLIRVMPELGIAAVAHANAQWNAGQRSAGDSTLLRAANLHVLDRITVLSTLRGAYVARGDVRAALGIKREMQAIAARDGRPGVIMAALDPWQESGEAWWTAWDQHIAIARRHRAFAKELTALLALGNAAGNAGDNARALRYLDQAATVAQHARSPGYRMLVYRLRGRAYSKVGDAERARRDLESAIALYPQVRDDYELAETYHNLGHVYEGEGQLAKAATAMDRFVALTRPFMHAQPKMMSLHDAAEIRWKAGWHAAAESALGEMVRVIDTQQSHHYWAGEYYERAGDYDKARQYYATGVRSGSELSLNYAGLARVYETLGLRDSASIAAQQHDRVMTDQLDTPLRPNLLLRLGRADEAMRIARAWVNTKSAQQHVQGEARARNALAEIYLAIQRPGEALSEARLAEAQAARLNLVTERAAAQRLTGVALIRGNDARGGLAVLERAVREVKRVPSIEERRATHMALAEARALTGDTAGALAQYRRAASQVDTISFGLIEDMARARFRATQRLPFDRAIALLLANPRRNISELVEWSQLRKASALAFGVAPPRVRSLDELQRSIAPDELVIDFMVVDSTIAALQLSRTTADVSLLRAAPQNIRKLIDRVRGPLLRVHAGRVDLARAPFDNDAAQQLYRALLGPLLSNKQLSRLTVAPDDALHGVVFDALVAGPDSYLIDRFTVRQIPSLALLSQARMIAPSAKVLVVSHKTPGSAREVTGIRSALRGARILTLDGAEATEPAVQQQRTRFDVVHVATHARADERDAMGSFLELEPAADADGYLHVSEIASGKTHNQLVVLSACETLGGPVFPGEGVMGVARAFLTSGARSVVATTWPVGAVSADLMARFYTELNAGRNVPDALRAAKLAIKRERATAHPFFWASFVPVTR